MKRKRITSDEVRRLAFEFQCAESTVRRVFTTGRARYSISRRLFNAMVRDGLLEPGDLVETDERQEDDQE